MIAAAAANQELGWAPQGQRLAIAALGADSLNRRIGLVPDNDSNEFLLTLITLHQEAAIEINELCAAAAGTSNSGHGHSPFEKSQQSNDDNARMITSNSKSTNNHLRPYAMGS